MVRFESYCSLENVYPIPGVAWMALALLLFPSGASACQTEAARPNAAQSKLHLQDGSGAYAAGKYRNLFAEIGHSSTAIQARSTPPINSSSMVIHSLRRYSSLLEEMPQEIWPM